MKNLEFKKGDEVFVKIPIGDHYDMWLETTVIKTTAKRVQVKTIEGYAMGKIANPYFPPKNVRLASKWGYNKKTDNWEYISKN